MGEILDFCIYTKQKEKEECAVSKEQKTNVMRILDKAHILYTEHTYDSKDGAIGGMSVASKLHQNVNQVFKTLVTQGHSKQYYVFVIPVVKELNLKAAAKSVGEKSVEMIPVSEIQKVTGYIRGGCSPIGMKKQYQTIIDESCTKWDTIIISGGKIGTQIELSPEQLLDFIHGRTDIITIE